MMECGGREREFQFVNSSPRLIQFSDSDRLLDLLFRDDYLPGIVNLRIEGSIIKFGSCHQTSGHWLSRLSNLLVLHSLKSSNES